VVQDNRDGNNFGEGTRGLAWCGGRAIADGGTALVARADKRCAQQPLHFDIASTHAQERLLDAAFEELATLLVVSNIHYLFSANTIGFSHSIPGRKSQSASDLQATNISSRKPLL
jgi:hypothetical protein